MKKADVIKNKKCGIKWFEHILTEFTIENIIEDAIIIHKQYPNTWVRIGHPEEIWNNIHWAFGNAYLNLYAKMKVKFKNNGQSSFNLDEVLTEEQIKYLSDKCDIKFPYKDCWERDN